MRDSKERVEDACRRGGTVVEQQETDTGVDTDVVEGSDNRGLGVCNVGRERGGRSGNGRDTVAGKCDQTALFHVHQLLVRTGKKMARTQT